MEGYNLKLHTEKKEEIQAQSKGEASLPSFCIYTDSLVEIHVASRERSFLNECSGIVPDPDRTLNATETTHSSQPDTSRPNLHVNPCLLRLQLLLDLCDGSEERGAGQSEGDDGCGLWGRLDFDQEIRLERMGDFVPCEQDFWVR